MTTVIVLYAFSFVACAAYMGFVFARERRRIRSTMLLPVYVTTRTPPRHYD